MTEMGLNMILNITGCMKPCQYKEYKLVWEDRKLAIGNPNLYIKFADGEVLIEKN